MPSNATSIMEQAFAERNSAQIEYVRNSAGKCILHHGRETNVVPFVPAGSSTPAGCVEIVLRL